MLWLWFFFSPNVLDFLVAELVGFWILFSSFLLKTEYLSEQYGLCFSKELETIFYGNLPYQHPKGEHFIQYLKMLNGTAELV